MIFDDGSGLRFGLDRESPFFFKCQRCRVCCNNKRIVPDAAEVERMAARLATTPDDFRTRHLDPADGTIRLRPDGDCVFLNEEGCGIHPARPLVCRLFPLGLLRNEAGRERFGLMPLHPDCVGYLSDEGTIAGYLESEGAILIPAAVDP
ncbi:MAG: YkgJ family cysteine cluster protein [Candidatus Aminicenantes bacterium]|nr:YkgJ family cysteine cluster protein [Candidatus Aminicenantes bacterium]